MEIETYFDTEKAIDTSISGSSNEHAILKGLSAGFRQDLWLDPKL